jgi:hypothetical protein
MFKPLSKDKINNFKNIGTLDIIRNVLKPSNALHTPHLIVFRNNKAGSIRLFECFVATTSRIYIMEDLDIFMSAIGLIGMDEASLYYFLDQTLMQAKFWAEVNKKEVLIVETKLPHITELFLKNGYDFGRVDKMGNDKGYRGRVNI